MLALINKFVVENLFQLTHRFVDKKENQNLSELARNLYKYKPDQ